MRHRGEDPDALLEHRLLKPDDIAEAYWMLHSQPKTAWTLELDIRPDRESF